MIDDVTRRKNQANNSGETTEPTPPPPIVVPPELEEAYKKFEIPPKSQLRFGGKRFLIATDSELSGESKEGYIQWLGVPKYAVAFTWPKSENPHVADAIFRLEVKKTMVESDEIMDIEVPKGLRWLGYMDRWANEVSTWPRWFSLNLSTDNIEGGISDATYDLVQKLSQEMYVNLHCHGEYSLRDGMGKVEKYCDLLLAQGRDVCCMTDHGSIGVWMRLLGACKDRNLKPIFGMEAYHNDWRGTDAASVCITAEQIEALDEQNKARKAEFDAKYETSEAKYKVKLKEQNLLKSEMTAKIQERRDINADLIESRKRLATMRVDKKEQDARGKEEAKKHKHSNHLILLARNDEGFRNIIRIHNNAWTARELGGGFYYKPRINDAGLRKWGKGIIGTTACLGGEIPQLLMGQNPDFEVAARRVEFYKECFEGYFYIELPLIEYWLQPDMNNKLITLSIMTNTKTIVTLDSHYLLKEHASTHNILTAISRNSTQDKMSEALAAAQEAGEEDDSLYPGQNYYCRTHEEVVALWEHGFVDKVYGKNKETGGNWIYKSVHFTKEVLDASLANAREIAYLCADVGKNKENIKIDDTLKLPIVKDDNDKEMDAPNKMRELAFAGLAEKGLLNNQEYVDRMLMELDVLCQCGFAGYIMTMKKIIDFVKSEYGEECCGWGRGSAAGSLVNYCLGLTQFNPVEEHFMDYNPKTGEFKRRTEGSRMDLFFERFLDATRSGATACTFAL